MSICKNLVISRGGFEGGIWVLIVPVSWSLLIAYFLERRDVILTRQRRTGGCLLLHESSEDAGAFCATFMQQ